MQANQSEFDKRMERMAKVQEQIQASQAKIQEQMQASQAKFDERMEKMDERMEKFDKQMENLLKVISAQSQKSLDHENKIEKVEKKAN